MVSSLYRLKIPPPPLLTNECLDSLAIEYLDASVAETMDSLLAQSRARILKEEADHNDLHAAAVLAPSPAAFEVRISSTKNNMKFFHASTGLVNEFLIGSIYMIMFVDSASRWQRAYGMRAKSDTPPSMSRVFWLT